MTSSLACTGVSISTLLTATQRSIGDYILVQVSATNSDGTSTNSPSSSSTAGSVVYASSPTTAPAGLTASVTNNTAVSLSWTAQSTPNNGYSSITYYIIEYKLSSSTTWTQAGTPTSSPFSVTGLTSLSTYYFRITSVNVFGNSPTSDGTTTATLNGVPSAPSQPVLSQTSGSTSVVLTWTAPSSTNGSPISSYSVELVTKTSTFVTIDSYCSEYSGSSIPSTATTCTILMTNIITQGGYSASDAGSYIQMKVLASNSYGPGPYSTSNANSVVIQVAPTLDVSTVTLAKTKSTITATWTSSPSTAAGYGYAPITYYLYRYKTSSGTWPADWSTASNISASSSLSVTLSSLSPQTAYNFEIIAGNQFGTGPTTPGTIWNITTSDKPATMVAPVVNLESSGTSINITFAQPAYYNNSITGYTLYF